LTYENKNCPVCGQIVPCSGRGRPPIYHPDCRKFEQLTSWLDDLLTQRIHPTDKGKKKIRSRLWYLANLLNIKKQGVCK